MDLCKFTWTYMAKTFYIILLRGRLLYSRNTDKGRYSFDENWVRFELPEDFQWQWNSNFRNFKRALWGISTDRNFRKILSRNSVPVDFPPGIFRIFYFSEVQQFPPNIWRTFHSTKNSENCGTDKNGTKISWENFQKMRKLLNFQKANQSTNIPEIPAENQMEPNSW